MKRDELIYWLILAIVAILAGVVIAQTATITRLTEQNTQNAIGTE